MQDDAADPVLQFYQDTQDATVVHPILVEARKANIRDLITGLLVAGGVAICRSSKARKRQWRCCMTRSEKSQQALRCNYILGSAN